MINRLFLVLAAMLWPALAAAQEEQFFAGKTMTIIVPIGPGGAYDAYARLVSRNLGRHLAGNPTIITRNMPGAGGVIASNYLYNVAPRDGTTLEIMTSSFASEQLFGNPQINYDARKFPAIGRLLDTTSVLFFWHASPVKTLADMLTKPATVAISSVNEIPAYRIRAMNMFLGASLKMIPGYPSAQDYVLATERGETDGGTSTFIGLSQLFSGYIREKKLNILVQFAAERDRELPDTPTVLELAKDSETREVFHQLVGNDEIGRSLVAAPNTPPARLGQLRSAFADMLVDPVFVADAQRSQLPLATKSGEDLQKAVADMLDVSPETLARVKNVSK